jgi:hypothetical protein
LWALFFLANWPRQPAPLKMWTHGAGWPWAFAAWDGAQLAWFDATALAADTAVLLALVPLAWLCALRRRSAACQVTGGCQRGSPAV